MISTSDVFFGGPSTQQLSLPRPQFRTQKKIPEALKTCNLYACVVFCKRVLPNSVRRGSLSRGSGRARDRYFIKSSQTNQCVTRVENQCSHLQCSQDQLLLVFQLQQPCLCHSRPIFCLTFPFKYPQIINSENILKRKEKPF